MEERGDRKREKREDRLMLDWPLFLSFLIISKLIVVK
jgi:hypothetical protein